MSIYKRYADLLTDYCLSVGKGDKVYVRSSYLAEPLLQELLIAINERGGHPHFDVSFHEQERLALSGLAEHQLRYENPFSLEVMTNFECYLYIRAPFNTRESTAQLTTEEQKWREEANRRVRENYSRRTAVGEMRRSLCQFPTAASAQDADMSLREYERFVFNACNLYEDSPIGAWGEVHDHQQRIVDLLNKSKFIEYKGSNIDVSFSCEERIWMNSDGKTNMPSGEVYTAPVEDSVNGKVTFTYPSLYFGEAAENVTLEIKNGVVEKWSATKGQSLLDKVFAIDGARVFGEAAIGTNKKIQQMTNNILFDEKIGGTIHMAVGQSYQQCGGKNKSAVHWDMITDMTEDGEIYADGQKIYEKGEFIF